jgi:hypothetical protein
MTKVRGRPPIGFKLIGEPMGGDIVVNAQGTELRISLNGIHDHCAFDRCISVDCFEDGIRSFYADTGLHVTGSFPPLVRHVPQ